MAISSMKSGLISRKVLVGNTAYNPFSPASITGLKAWYDASDTATISVSGTAVTQWNDKSGNGYNVSQGTSANRPTSGVSTLNGKNVINFDGADDFLTASSSVWSFLVQDTNYLIGVVVKAGNTSDPENYLGIIGVPSGAPGTALYADYRQAKNDLQHYQANASVGTVLQNTITNTFAANTWSNVGLIAQPNNATAANRSYLYKNTNAAVQSNTSTATPSSSGTSNYLEIGRYINGNGYLSGSIAEIVIVDATGATDANRILLRNYFTSKWGV